MITPRSLAACVLAALIALAPLASTAGPVLDFTGGIQNPAGGDVTLGWAFTVTSPITVDALGLFDVGGNGLSEDHKISLWNSDGSLLLASVGINDANSTAVTSTSSFGSWRFTDIAPLVLAAGEYVIGALYLGSENSTDAFARNATATTVAGVTFDEPRAVVGDVFPANPSVSNFDGFFGPNLSAVPFAAVAEPASLVLLGSGLAGLTGLAAWRARRRR